MIKMNLKQAADILEGKTDQAEIEFCGVSIDTRTLQAGNLFIALSGSNVDGHQFLEHARKQGAAAALVERKIDNPLPQLVVKDTTAALGQLSAAWRDQFKLPIIAVTGSNGKTTLKNMLAAIMIQACNQDVSQVLSTSGNFNNHLGLPLMLCQLNKDHRFAAIEMGMNHFGEIDYLSRLTRPTAAIITNAAASHLDGLGSIAGVAQAKAEIFHGLQSDGMAILNRDDEFYDYWHDQIGHHPFLSFGMHPDADVTAKIKEGELAQHIALTSPQGDINIHLPLLGKHNSLNALAAAAACLSIGISLEDIKFGLESMQAATGRLQVYQLENGVTLIDDSYNANPFSLQAAIQALTTFNGKKILVLGDMRELGSNEKSLHEAAGTSIRHAGIDCLFTYGDLSENTSSAFGDGAYHFKEQQKLISALRPFLHNQTTILVKGSRSMHMDKVVKELLKAG